MVNSEVLHHLIWLHLFDAKGALCKELILGLISMGIHRKQELVQLRKNVLFHCTTTVKEHVFSHLLSQVVLRVKALHCFAHDHNDALHGLRQEGCRLWYRLVLDLEGIEVLLHILADSILV